jgi:small multidrug resistance pump
MNALSRVLESVASNSDSAPGLSQECPGGQSVTAGRARRPEARIEFDPVRSGVYRRALSQHHPHPRPHPFSTKQLIVAYLYLFIAIIAEVIGTSAFKLSEGFTRPLPTLVIFLCYGIAFYLMSLIVQSIPLAIAYAIWSGLGILLITLIAMLAFGQVPDIPALVGMVLIVAGVVLIQGFSRVEV